MRNLIASLTFDDYGPLIAKEISELEESMTGQKSNDEENPPIFAPIQKAVLLVTAREA